MVNFSIKTKKQGLSHGLDLAFIKMRIIYTYCLKSLTNKKLTLIVIRLENPFVILNHRIKRDKKTDYDTDDENYGADNISSFALSFIINER